MLSDPIADLLTRIRNAQQKGIVSVNIPYSKLKHSLIDLFKQEGYIASYFVSDEPVATKSISVRLKYVEEKPVIKKLTKVSKPGQRIYKSSKELPRSLRGLGTIIVSTSSGLMTERQARAKNLGGEVLCEIQ